MAAGRKEDSHRQIEGVSAALPSASGERRGPALPPLKESVAVSLPVPDEVPSTPLVAAPQPPEAAAGCPERDGAADFGLGGRTTSAMDGNYSSSSEWGFTSSVGPYSQYSGYLGGGGGFRDFPSLGSRGSEGWSPLDGRASSSSQGTWSNLPPQKPRGGPGRGQATIQEAGEEEAEAETELAEEQPRGALGGSTGRPRPDYEVFVEVEPRIKPTFRRGPKNTFVFELESATINIVAVCEKREGVGSSRGTRSHRSEDEIPLELPEVSRVVFDPSAETPPEGMATGREEKYGSILEVPQTVSIGAHIKLHSPAGTLVLEDMCTTNGERRKVAENTLHYKMKVDGQLPLGAEGVDFGVHSLGVDLQVVFSCMLELGSGGFPSQEPAVEDRRTAKPSEVSAVDAGTGGGGCGQVPAAASSRQQSSSETNG